MARHLITGAGSGIGAALAARLYARGEELVLLARSAERAEELSSTYGGADTVVADLADPGAIEAAELPDRLDSVVHAAGVVELGAVAELDAEGLQRQLAVNLVAPALLTRRALPAVRAAEGTVVFVNSSGGQRANPRWSGYAASKFGLRALADSLREEERSNRVRVTSVFPGRVATPMQEKVHAQEGKEYDPGAWIRPGTVADAILDALDLPADASLPEVSLKPR